MILVFCRIFSIQYYLLLEQKQFTTLTENNMVMNTYTQKLGNVSEGRRQEAIGGDEEE